ncbi:hypothetical protein PFISCL1PPCAC_1863 [Pristionchus fissidentatus]|uniref:CX domain-containing protein n=1 Tax=Pristionchus fissidentatus TaxID=1538716 RepID=A0AAV5UVM8_9BILA|nr:hypothetical protein PFISCL1PPCAC_1863 [Pristionchus fissidentatus]
MSQTGRWGVLPASNTFTALNNPPPLIQNADIPSVSGPMGTEVFQHGSIGDFVRSELEGAQSGFMRCVYKAKHTANQTVTVMCEKNAGCCLDGCCPKDQFWMAGVFVLLAFVLLVLVVGSCVMVICYQRSKSKQRKEEHDLFTTQSQIGVPPPGPAMYSTYGPEY